MAAAPANAQASARAGFIRSARLRIVQAVLLGAAYVLMFGLGRAAAAPVPGWSATCATGDVNYNLCTVVAERDQYLAGQLATLDDQQQRLDLVWIGVWLVGGLLLVRIVQPYWNRLYSWSEAPQ